VIPNDVFKEPIMKNRLVFAAALAAALVSASALAQGPGYRFNQTNPPGWMLMTPEERTEYQKKMRAAKTYEECKAIMEEHRATMEARAKEKGVTLRTPRVNACDRMKARGILQ
jgi:hypothetical protein